MRDMKIIFGQGNPGARYAASRHNVGFMMLDSLAKEWEVSFSSKSKFQAEIAETSRDGEKILLVKPTTFYNETGNAAHALIDFYKLDPAQDFLVIHDELALPFGTIKTRQTGSDAGNNGIKSLNSHIGNSYARIRIGIYSPLRDQMDDADFVLGRFSSNEQALLKNLTPQVSTIVSEFIHGTFSATKTSLPSA